jgi:hypothetical protein
MRKISLRLVTVALLATPVLAVAHTGGPLDADGCHADHRTGTYHCHRGAAAGYTFPNRAAMEEAVRTDTFPEKTVDEEGFFSKLWPFGKEHEQEEAPAAPGAESGAAPSSSAPPGAAAVSPGPPNEIEQKLKVLQGLYEMGLITKEEYEAKRKAVLDQL